MPKLAILKSKLLFEILTSTAPQSQTMDIFTAANLQKKAQKHSLYFRLKKNGILKKIAEKNFRNIKTILRRTKMTSYAAKKKTSISACSTACSSTKRESTDRK